ncbi:MAG: penicillin-binding protein 2 [Candidatus Eisenbacteria bacterium]|nr:penicillin-binding protein 2 [Candidatus Eisenbacteria bacterium]
MTERESKGRVLELVTVVAFALLALRVLTFQVLQSPRYKQLSDENRVRIDVLQSPRGDICDRNGRVLANSLPSFNIVLDAFERSYLRKEAFVESTIVSVGRLLGVNEDSILSEAMSGKSASYGRIVVRRGASLNEISVVEERLSELPGVEIDVAPVRHYTLGDTTCHLLGYLGEVSADELEEAGTEIGPGSLVGRGGVEMEYDHLLRGRDGARLVEVDALGRRVGLLDKSLARTPRRGSTLVLTVDRDLQRVAESAFGDWERGAVVVLDLKTGGVLALVSRPAFDPNLFSSGLSLGEWRKLLLDRRKPLLNRSIQGTYPPGSVFKLVSTISGLASGTLREDATLGSCSGKFPYGGRVFKCWSENGHGSLNLHDAIVQSCDVFFYRVGLKVGLDRISKYAKEVGLGEKADIDLPGERRGLIPDKRFYDKKFGPGKWARGLLLNLAIGQGEILATPLQLAILAEAVALRGVVLKPHVLQAIRVQDGRTIYTKLEKIEVKGVDRSLFETVASAMEGVVEGPSGTGSRARVQSVVICGKTGTAQNPFGEDHAIFVAFAPAETPEIALCVIVENGGHGGTVAAPIAQKIMDHYFRAFDRGGI